MVGIRMSPEPPPLERTLTLVRLKAGQSVVCHICSRSVWGMITHWTGDRSVPCTDERTEIDPSSSTCQGCQKGWPARWKGFLHAIRCDNRQQFFVELTSTATTLFHDQVPDRKNVRGFRIEITRTRGADNGRLRVTLLDTGTANMRLPDEVDPAATLFKLWKLKKPVDGSAVIP